MQTASERNIASGASQEEECINMQTASERNIVSEDKSSKTSNTMPKEDCINMQTASERNKVRKKKNLKRVGPDGGIQKTKAFKDLETLAVMFVEQTKGGVWQKKLQRATE
jgi:S-adenosylmethionine synthetase